LGGIVGKGVSDGIGVRVWVNVTVGEDEIAGV